MKTIITPPFAVSLESMFDQPGFTFIGIEIFQSKITGKYGFSLALLNFQLIISLI